MDEISAAAVSRVLHALRGLPVDCAASEVWGAMRREQWPAFFCLVDLVAQLPGLQPLHRAATRPALEGWPELRAALDDTLRIQRFIDRPVEPGDAVPARVYGLAEQGEARAELERDHCASVDFLLEPARRPELDRHIARLREASPLDWGKLRREQAPALFGLFDDLLGNDPFRRLTGFDPRRDEYLAALAWQNLAPAGIAWHRDLYWPKEWVGEDVFAILYGLSADTPAKGGAFLYYVPGRNEVRRVYRQPHQATLLWNGRDNDRRLLHAVAGYHTPDTSRHLVILQCLRRGGRP